VTRVALVALGGAIGSVARYGVGALAAQLLGPTFPWGTLFVNLSGSFLIALVMHVALTGTAISLEMRIFLTTGIMGGFTTYSSFNYETLALIDQRAYALASLNLAATVVGCLLAGVLGLASGRALAGA
jgi:CrcB protein